MMSPTTQDDVHPFEVLVPVKLSAEDLIDVLVGAIEGGMMSSWCPVIRLHEEGEEDEGLPRPQDPDVVVTSRRDPASEVWNEYLARNVAEGGSITLYEYGEEMDWSPTWRKELVPHRLDSGKLLEGVRKYAELRKGLDLEQMDGVEADMIMQYAVLGEVRYG